MQTSSGHMPSNSTADTDRITTRCPYNTPRVYTAENRAVWQYCEEGMWVTYDVDTLKEISREPHTYCEGTGIMRHCPG